MLESSDVEPSASSVLPVDALLCVCVFSTLALSIISGQACLCFLSLVRRISQNKTWGF